MHNELSQIAEECLATLERDICYLKKGIDNLDSYGGNIFSNEIRLGILTKNFLFIKTRQGILK